MTLLVGERYNAFMASQVENDRFESQRNGTPHDWMRSGPRALPYPDRRIQALTDDETVMVLRMI